MLVATFGDTTAWVGKTIVFEGDQFVLDGHGPIAPGAIVQYDQQGHLTWSSPALRQWVYEQAATQAPSPPPQEETSQAITPDLPNADVPGEQEEAEQDKSEAKPERVKAGPMLVATFRERTVRAGRTILHDRGAFIVEEEGPRTAAEVMEFDRRGQLEWSDAGTRAWVGAKAAQAVSDPDTRRLLQVGLQQYESGELSAVVKTLQQLSERARKGDEVAARGTLALCAALREQDEKLKGMQIYNVSTAAQSCGSGWAPLSRALHPPDEGEALPPGGEIAPPLEPGSPFQAASAEPEPPRDITRDIAPPQYFLTDAPTDQLLELARKQIDEGAAEEAVETLWLLDSRARQGDEQAAREVIDLAAQVGTSVDSNLAAEGADLAARSREALTPGYSRVQEVQSKTTSSPEKKGIREGTLGFWLVIVGLLVPIVGIVGFVMCCGSLIRARRHGTPPGLAWAGVMVGCAVIALNVIGIVFLIVTN